MQTLYIIRGLPGSGKTTLAKSLGFQVVEADDWFTSDETGEYVFIPEEIGAAHTYCLSKAKRLLSLGHTFSVANTFSQQWEIQPYIDAAKYFNAYVKIIEAKGDFGSIHNVPQNVIDAMKARWQKEIIL